MDDEELLRIETPFGYIAILRRRNWERHRLKRQELDGQLLSDNAKIRAEIRRRITARNRTVAEVLQETGLEIAYERPEDHLYLTFGTPAEALSIPTEDAMDSVLLYDPETYDVRGFEVLFFMEKISRGQSTGDFWNLVADLISSHGDTVYIPAGREVARAEEALRYVALT